MRKRSMIWKAAAVLAATVILGACGGGTTQARSITLTFIRHAQSEANANGIIDTSVPGQGLSRDGQSQAQQLAHSHHDFDAVYASTMARAQQTAAPLAAELGKQVEVLQGIQEINAGWFNGKPVSMDPSTYLLAPADWLRTSSARIQCRCNPDSGTNSTEDSSRPSASTS